MFEQKTVFIKKEVIRTYDKDGKLVSERTIVQDGGSGQEEAEKKLDKAEKKLDSVFNRMDDLFKHMGDVFKDF